MFVASKEPNKVPKQLFHQPTGKHELFQTNNGPKDVMK
jgi:hypothetical protein